MHQASAVPDRFDVQRDRAGRRVARDIVQDVGRRHVRRVAEPYRQADPLAGLGEPERERVVHAAAGRDHGDAPGRHRRRTRHEARRQPGRRHDEAAGIGPEQPYPRGGGDRGQLPLQCHAVITRLGESAAADDRGAGAGRGCLREHSWAGLGGHADHRQVDRAVGGRRAHGTVHLLVPAVDQREGPRAGGEPAQRPGHDGAELARAARRPDHGDPARREQRGEGRPVARVPLALLARIVRRRWLSRGGRHPRSHSLAVAAGTPTRSARPDSSMVTAASRPSPGSMSRAGRP